VIATFHETLLRHLPLASAAAWLLIVTFQVRRDRYHTWSEVFFLSTCVAAGAYALSDWVFFNAGSQQDAFVAAGISLASVTLMTLMFLLFTIVYVSRPRRLYWGFAAVAGAMIFLIPFGMLRGVLKPDPAGLYLPQLDPTLFGLLLVYVLAFAGGGLVNLYRLFRIVRQHSERLAGRTLGLIVVFTIVLVTGLGTNGYLGVTQDVSFPPPFSTLLLFIGVATMLTLYPIGRERISEVMRRFKAVRYVIKAVFLIYEDGTVIGSQVRPGERLVDTDLFSATLDVIQNFMRTSFPGLRGKWLRSIAHGDHTIVMERGRHAYLTILLEGEETDQLRRQMRDLLLDFEARNREVLTKWRGLPDDAVGKEEALLPFFEGAREGPI